MAKLIVPQRGQPLDVSYMYSLVETVNQLSEVVGDNQSMTKIIGRNGKSNTVATARSNILGITTNVATSKNVTAGMQEPFAINYNFKYPPIVVATPWNTGDTDAGKSVSVVITKVSTTSASFLVRYDTAGVATVDINVLAIGIQN